MGLTDVRIKKAASKEKPYRLSDGGGLFLMVHPKGGKYWQFRYRHVEKEKLLSLGAYPAVSLAEAREKLISAKKKVRDGADPAAERKTEKQNAKLAAEHEFRAIAAEWLEQRNAIWTPRHARKVEKQLEQDIFPQLGTRPISQIRPTDLLMCLRKIETRGATYTAHRTQQIVGQIFRFAVASGRVERDITSDLRGALRPVKKANYNRLSANELPEFLERLEGYDGDLQTRLGIELLVMFFVRTIELRGASWKEFDFKKAEWRIPASRMKMRQEHVVPLCRQALALLRQLEKSSGSYEHLFPNRNRPRTFISENTMLYAIYRIGYHNRTTAHGFRGMASTILHEQGFSTEIIERQLAHRDRNSVRASYNHAAYLPARREMMQWWGDYLESAGLKIDHIA